MKKHATHLSDIALRPYQSEVDHPAIAEMDHLMGLGILEYCDPHQDMVFAEADGDGCLIGYGRVWHLVRDADTHEYLFEISVRSGWEGGDIERRLFDWLGQRTSILASEQTHVKSCTFTAYVSDKHTATLALLESEGFAVRGAERVMTRSLQVDIPELPLPAGIEIRPAMWQQASEIVSVLAEAFGHPVTASDVEMTKQDFEHWVIGAPAEIDATLVAWDMQTDQAVSLVLNHLDDAKKQGYLSQLGTRVSWRGRGVMSALIVRSLQMFKARRLDEACLQVQTDNANAIRLYEKLGFRASHHVLTYQRTA